MSVLPTVEVPFLERCGTGSEVLKCIFMVLVNLASRIWVGLHVIIICKSFLDMYKLMVIRCQKYYLCGIIIAVNWSKNVRVQDHLLYFNYSHIFQAAEWLRVSTQGGKWAKSSQIKREDWRFRMKIWPDPLCQARQEPVASCVIPQTRFWVWSARLMGHLKKKRPPRRGLPLAILPM